MKQAVQLGSRMMNFCVVMCGVCYLVGAPYSASAQGPLTPPGAPAPMMKTLDQVEPRTAVTNLPYTIAQSGSYYLTGNLVESGTTTGLVIQADNVTLDLNGFALLGSGAGAVNGVQMAAAQQNCAIYGGTIRGWGGSGISAALSRCRVERLFVSNNGSFGVSVGPGSLVKDCIAAQNSSFGLNIGANSTVISCVVVSNGANIVVGNGCTIKDCTANASPLGDGIFAGQDCMIQGCTTRTNAFQGIEVGSGCLIKDCTANANKLTGIHVGSQCLILNCLSLANGSYGVVTTGDRNRIEGNVVVGNLNGDISVGLGTNVVIRNSGSVLFAGDTLVGTNYTDRTLLNADKNPHANFGVNALGPQ